MAAGRLLRTIWPSWLALPSRLRARALDLLVVLELELEQLHHLHGRARRRRRWRRREWRSAGKTFSMVRWLMRLPEVARRSPAITTPSA